MIVILAQCGSYVPAEQASIPIRDQLCCRIGNADDQEHNISTFLLEMKETAFLCNHATERSLVLVDELGRATSNEDGVALAWATGEYLLKKRALTFFVTHYPQLSRLSDTYPHRVQNVHMGATIGQVAASGEIRYTHKLEAGSCPVSNEYGVELAAACGWPANVVQNALQLKTDVDSLLPDDRVCDDESHTDANQAYRACQQVDQQLTNLVSGTEMLSLSEIRNRLHTLQRNLLDGCDRGALQESVDRLLFPHRPNRKLSTSQHQHELSESGLPENGKPLEQKQTDTESSSDDDTTSIVSSSDSSSSDDFSFSTSSSSSDESNMH